METLKKIKERLADSILEQLNHGIENVDCEEMYKACDMLKDTAEAMYYASIVKAMEEGEEEPEKAFYTPRKRKMTPEEYREMDFSRGRLYYTETAEMMNDGQNNGQNMGGRTEQKMRKYYESKMHGSSSEKMQNLEEYAKTLTEDITDMIKDASDNEKQMLRTKLQMLAQKI